ncbi:MAG: hypothetical protein NWF01_05920 [Candidatus Bathyarchaeota archaeon]|nr:hypothetical protein [Candidatus Bathyarchaeota archaeon]
MSRIDRVLFDLTIQVTADIRSSQLARSISIVVSKLEELLTGKFFKLTRTIGCSLAGKISIIAQGLGNISAKDWAPDLSFAKYLAVMHANK